VDAQLLAAFGGTALDGSNGTECGIAVGESEALLVRQNGFWEPFEGPAVDKFTFIRSINIAGLQGREYSLASGSETVPGSCMVDVNTRALNSITVLAARDGGDTDPARMCQKAREVATVMVKRFVPAAGGTPYPGTPQQPAPGVLGRQPRSGPCDVFDGPITYAFLEGVAGQSGQDGPATTCTWSKGEARGSARLTLGAPANWQTSVPPLTEGEIIADTKLGVMPARVQLTKDGTECAETVQYAPGETLRFTYRNPDSRTFTAAELCRIAENVLGDALDNWIDLTTR